MDQAWGAAHGAPMPGPQLRSAPAPVNAMGPPGPPPGLDSAIAQANAGRPPPMEPSPQQSMAPATWGGRASPAPPGPERVDPTMQYALRGLGGAAPAIPGSAQVPAAGAVGAGGGGGLNKYDKEVGRAEIAVRGDYARERADQERLGEARVREQRIMGNFHQQEADRRQDEADREARIQADTQKRDDTYLAKTQQMADDLKNQKMDPGQYMAGKGFFAKLGMIAAAAVGGWDAGINRHENTVLKAIDDNINENIRAQEANYNHKKDTIAARNTVYGQMIQASGNARLARADTRNLMLEVVKQDMLSRGARLGLPAIEAETAVKVQTIQRQQDEERKHTAIVRRDEFRRQAAAAEAAREARRKAQFEEELKVAELGLKAYGAESQRIEAEGKGNATKSEIDKNFADRILRHDVPARQVAVGRLKDQLRDASGNISYSKGIPGVGPLADFRENLAPPVGSSGQGALERGFRGTTLGPIGGYVANRVVGLNSSERINRQDWARAGLKYQVEVTGAGGSDQQMAQIKEAFAKAKTPEEQANAVMLADQTIQALKLAAAQGDPDVIRRAESAGTLPASVQVK